MRMNSPGSLIPSGRHGCDKTWNLVDAYLKKAQEMLEGMTRDRKDSPHQEILAGLIDHVRNRNA